MNIEIYEYILQPGLRLAVGTQAPALYYRQQFALDMCIISLPAHHKYG